MSRKVMTLADAVAQVSAGCHLGVGGVLLQRKPIAFLQALCASDTGLVEFHSFLASLDAEMLAAYGCISHSHTGYVGFEQLGFAPAFSRAADAGQVRAHEYTEFLFVAGLRAALAGLPFMPAKGGQGSATLAELGFAEITCPYTGVPLVAVPAMQLDVTVIHAEAADEHGNVLGPVERDFLFDLDANMARAADRCIVTVEQIVPTSTILAERDRTLLFAYEVDAVVEAPRGAAPTSLPGCYEPDLAALQTYIRRVQQTPEDAAAAMDALLDDAAAVPGR